MSLRTGEVYGGRGPRRGASTEGNRRGKPTKGRLAHMEPGSGDTRSVPLEWWGLRAVGGATEMSATGEREILGADVSPPGSPSSAR